LNNGSESQLISLATGNGASLVLSVFADLAVDGARLVVATTVFNSVAGARLAFVGSLPDGVPDTDLVALATKGSARCPFRPRTTLAINDLSGKNRCSARRCIADLGATQCGAWVASVERRLLDFASTGFDAGAASRGACAIFRPWLPVINIVMANSAIDGAGTFVARSLLVEGPAFNTAETSFTFNTHPALFEAWATGVVANTPELVLDERAVNGAVKRSAVNGVSERSAGYTTVRGRVHEGLGAHVFAMAASDGATAFSELPGVPVASKAIRRAGGHCAGLGLASLHVHGAVTGIGGARAVAIAGATGSSAIAPNSPIATHTVVA